MIPFLVVVAIVAVISHRYFKNKALEAAQLKKAEDEKQAREEESRRLALEFQRKGAELIRETQEWIDKKAAEEASTINVPDRYQGKQMIYHYFDVDIDPVPDGIDHVSVGQPLKLVIVGDDVEIYQDSFCVGHMRKNRIAGMVKDWQKKGDPYLAFVAKYAADSSSAQIGIAFYTDMLANYLSRHPNARLYKLLGKPEDFAICLPGTVLSIDSDVESDKYYAIEAGSRVGRLPAAAVRYAKEHDIEPEELDIIVVSNEYDPDKDRDVITVYISD